LTFIKYCSKLIYYMTVTMGIVYALIAIVVSFSLSAIGSAKGIGSIAAAASGLLSKEPAKFKKVLALTIFPIINILFGILFISIVLMKVKMLGGTPLVISKEKGLAVLVASLPVGISSLVCSIWQGEVAASGMKILAEKPENLSQTTILMMLVEVVAIFGLAISLFVVLAGINF